MTYDTADGYLLMFGGGNTAGALNDTWELTNERWTRLHPTTAPPPLGGSSMVFDAHDGYVLLFGGGGPGGLSSQTWKFNSGQWTRLNPSVHPPARSSATMVYDAADQLVLLFGGSNSTGDLNDTWSFSSGSWTLLNPVSSPAPRAGAEMVYDPADGYVVLYGGGGQVVVGSGNIPDLSDTWTFKGGVWANITASSDPAGRGWASMAYDSADRFVVMFGGENTTLGTDLNDTWKFLNGTWSTLNPPISPAPRSDFALADNPMGSQVVLFGGGDVAGSLMNDTWTFNVTNVPRPVVTTPAYDHSMLDVGQTVRYTTNASGGYGKYSYLWRESSSALGCLLSNSAAISCIPRSSGIGYTVSVMVMDSIGDSSNTTTSAPIEVFSDPIVSKPVASRTTGLVGDPVSFSSVLSVPGAGNDSYNWSSSGGGMNCPTISSLTVNCTLTMPGSFSATIVVRDSNDGVGTNTSSPVTVSFPPIRVNDSASVINGTAPLSVTFTAMASGGSLPYTWQWNFGDTATSGMQNVSHVFVAAGSYDVNLTVRDQHGDVGFGNVITIKVSAQSTRLTATLHANPTNAAPGELIQFSASIAGGDGHYSFAWRFGDGSSSADLTPSHAYSTPGSYEVRLEVNDTQGQSALSTMNITIASSAPTGFLSQWLVPLSIVGVVAIVIASGAVFALKTRSRRRRAGPPEDGPTPVTSDPQGPPA